jgi:putative FmdB family regulatory protein
MPTYEYECKTCGHTFEVFQSMSDEPVKVCPECGKATRRLINGGSGIIFKGSGFYVTDKADSSKKTGAAASKPAEKTGEPKPKETASTKDAASNGNKAETKPKDTSSAEKKAAG